MDAYGELRRLGLPILTTREAAARLRSSETAASHALRSMERAGVLRRLRRGLWALDPDLDPFAVPPYLTSPYPAYVSLWSALSRHEMIEQIPRRISVVTLDRARRIETALGFYELHRITPELFGGFEGSAESGYLAVPEKAFFDLIYLRSTRRTKAYFPELTLPDDFDHDALGAWVEKVGDERLRTVVERSLRRALRLVIR